MSTTLRNRLFYIFIFLFSFVFKDQAQFLDKQRYLVDSLEISDLKKEDKVFLDHEMEEYFKTLNDTIKLNCLNNVVEGVNNEKVWTKYNRLMQTMAEAKLKSSKGREYFVFKGYLAQALNNYGYYYFNYSDNFDLALKYYFLGMKMNEEINNVKALITSYSNIANVYQNEGELGTAIAYYKKSLALDSVISDKTLFLAPINNMAQIYMYMNDTVNALKNLTRCLIISTGSKDKSLRAHLMHNIGLIKCRGGDSTGLQFMKDALVSQKQIGDKKGIVQSSLSLAGTYREGKNLKKAKEYLAEARIALNEINNPNQEGLYFNMLANVLESEHKRDEAISMYERSIAIYKEFSLGPDMYNVLGNVIRLFGSEKKYAMKKLEMYELMQKVTDKVNKGNIQQMILKQRFEDQLKIQEINFKAEQKVKEEKNKSEKHKQQLILSGVSIILLVVIIFSFFIYKALKENQAKNKIISEQKLEVEKQKHLVEEKHKDITDSINYAQKIQHALTVSDKVLQSKVKNIFVLYKPKDIVSGDFYWYSEKNNLKLLAVADCTGHGVPGAFMSMIGITMLNQIVNEKGVTSPAEILNLLRDGVINSLNQTDEEAGKRDGMDVAVIAWNDNSLIYAGANNPCLMMRENNFIELKPNKQPVGLYEKQEPFTEQKIDLQKNDSVFLFSDGITDQFGGEKGKKIKLKGLKEWLIDLADKPASEQKNFLETKLNSWKGNISQTDDILLIGFKN